MVRVERGATFEIGGDNSMNGARPRIERDNPHFVSDFSQLVIGDLSKAVTSGKFRTVDGQIAAAEASWAELRSDLEYTIRRFVEIAVQYERHDETWKRGELLTALLRLIADETRS